MGKFNFRLPILTDLTPKQRRAIDSAKPILLTGVPGSGKTVVSIYRLSNSLKSGKKAILFTYNRMLRLAIGNSSETDPDLGISKDNIYSIHDWFTHVATDKLWLTEYDKDSEKLYEKIKHISYDEIIFDEGQDLPVTIYKAFKKIAELSVGADDAQRLYDVDTTESEILNILSSLQQHELHEIKRNSFEIFNFAKEFVPNNARAHDEELLNRMPQGEAEKPTIYVDKVLDDTKEKIKKLIESGKGGNIAILVPSQHLVELYYAAIKDNFQCSMYHSGLSDEKKQETENDLQNILVTTFKSAKGMEFDTVIMLGFEQTKDEDRNQYFVGATRAKTRLYILCIGKLSNIFETFDKNCYELKMYDS